jgi:hypothetical protein
MLHNVDDSNVVMNNGKRVGGSEMDTPDATSKRHRLMDNCTVDGALDWGDGVSGRDMVAGNCGLTYK